MLSIIKWFALAMAFGSGFTQNYNFGLVMFYSAMVLAFIGWVLNRKKGKDNE